MTSPAIDARQLLAPIRRIHEQVRDEVVAECQKSELDQLAAVADDAAEGDTIYAIDRISEDVLVDLFAKEVASLAPLVLVAEGIEGGELVLPRGASERSEEHTSELQSPCNLVCRLLLEKKKYAKEFLSQHT